MAVTLGSTGVTFPNGSIQTVAATGGGFTLGTPVATTSGTSIDFTGIPAGTKQIIFTFVGVSINGTDKIIIQLGDSGGVETSGYSGNSAELSTTVSIDNRTSGFVINFNIATDVMRGSVTLTLQSSSAFTWVAQGGLFLSSSRACVLAGSKALTAELTSVRLTTLSGTDAFDAGSVNIAYI